jgi:MoaA/NifB/PqqE/SkfB family radical SAM enzyme
MPRLDLLRVDNPKYEDGKLSFIGIDLSRACNLKCGYCFSDAGRADENELSLKERIGILDNAYDMGAQSLNIAGAGEPLVDKDFEPLIAHANQLGLVSVVYTNGLRIDERMADFMYSHGVTPVVKLESLDAGIHDELTGINGSHGRVINALEHLLDAGFEPKDSVTRLGVAALYTAKNLAGLPALAEWCMEKGIRPVFDFLSPSGRINDDGNDLLPNFEDALDVHAKIFGGRPKHKKPCIVWRYGLVIGNTGEAKYCTGVNVDIGNIRNTSLQELLDLKNSLFPAQKGINVCPLKEDGNIGSKSLPIL